MYQPAQKMCIYNASIISILLYRSQTWPLSESLTKMIDGFDLQAICMSGQIRQHEHIFNAKVCMCTWQLPLHNLITSCSLCWFGHLLYGSPDHPSLTIYHFDPSKAGWKRPRGAPPTHTGVMCSGVTLNSLDFILMG